MSFEHPSLAQTLRRMIGAIVSGKPAAYMGMSVIALGPIGRKLHGMDELINPSDDIDASQELPPSLLLVSPPRSGSTLIYQVLTRTIPCVYVSNLHLLNPRGASATHTRKNRWGAARGFRNYYGYTPTLHDVHEGNEYLAALFHGDPSPERLRQRFAALVQMMGATPERPLIFKNVRFHPRVAELAKAVPELHVVRIERDLGQVVQSVVRAYHELGTFHPIPDSVKNQGITSPVEFAVRVIRTIQGTIEQQLAEMPEERSGVIAYETFCEDPWQAIENLAMKHLGLPPEALVREGLTETLHASHSQKVSDQEVAEMERYIGGNEA